MDEEDVVLFVVGWVRPKGDATTMVLCEYCGAERYSSEENIRAARDRKMRVTCMECYERLDKEQGSVIGGRVRGGRVIEEKDL